MDRQESRGILLNGKSSNFFVVSLISCVFPSLVFTIIRHN